MIEINRLAEAGLWRYVEVKNMMADIGTWKGAKIDDVLPGSEWILGIDEFPVKTVVVELVLTWREQWLIDSMIKCQLAHCMHAWFAHLI